MRKNNPTTSIGDLVRNTAFGGIMKGHKMEQVVKCSTLFSFWSSIVGAKFARYTKPYSLKYQKLYVSVKSPVIAQELGLYKTKIMTKINSYATPLGLVVNDIIFNYKNYTVQTPETLIATEDKPVKINKEQLENINLDKNIETSIKNTVEKMNFLNEEQKEKFATKIQSSFKVRNLQEK